MVHDGGERVEQARVVAASFDGAQPLEERVGDLVAQVPSSLMPKSSSFLATAGPTFGKASKFLILIILTTWLSVVLNESATVPRDMAAERTVPSGAGSKCRQASSPVDAPGWTST